MHGVTANQKIYNSCSLFHFQKHTIEGDVPTISRNCHTLQEGDCVELDRFKLSYGGFLSQHCCRNNLCNSAGAMTFNLFILGAVVLVGLFVCIDLS